MPAFWDASAVVPLTVDQPATRRIREVLADDPSVWVWWATPIEVRSVLARLAREGTLEDSRREQAVRRLAHLKRGWREVLPTERVRTLAEELPERTAVTAADALQLAAALIWCGERPRGRMFICTDRRLAVAAIRTGFTVLP